MIVGFGACCCSSPACLLIQLYDAVDDVVHDVLWSPGSTDFPPEVGQLWKDIGGSLGRANACLLVVTVASIACDYEDADALWGPASLWGPYASEGECDAA